MNKENYVIVRADRAGVFFGKLVEKKGSEVTLNECRKLYRWDGACAVEQLASDGVLESKKSNCQFTVTVDNSTIMQVIQVIPCSEKAVESIKSVSVWKR